MTVEEFMELDDTRIALNEKWICKDDVSGEYVVREPVRGGSRFVEAFVSLSGALDKIVESVWEQGNESH